jgi:SWI/SNF-related matrix-associated actin-dependent regulator of chromatin subfamily A member 5
MQIPSPSKTKNQMSAEDRKQKKQKRKVAEGQLQVKRQAMDKAKVR